MILVRAQEITDFLLGGREHDKSVQDIEPLVRKVQSHSGPLLGFPTHRELLEQICEEVLSLNLGQDTCLGVIAEVAASLHDKGLFSRTVSQLTRAFNDHTYQRLGQLLSPQKLEVSEDEYAFLLNSCPKCQC